MATRAKLKFNISYKKLKAIVFQFHNRIVAVKKIVSI